MVSQIKQLLLLAVPLLGTTLVAGPTSADVKTIAFEGLDQADSKALLEFEETKEDAGSIPTLDVSSEFLEQFLVAAEGLSPDNISDIINNAVQEASFDLPAEEAITLKFRCAISPLEQPVKKTVGAVITSPFVAIAHALGWYDNTAIEKHLASQLIKMWKTKMEIDRLEAENDPVFKAEKLAARRETLLKRWSKTAGHMWASGFIGGLGGTAATIFIGATILNGGSFPGLKTIQDWYTNSKK